MKNYLRTTRTIINFSLVLSLLSGCGSSGVTALALPPPGEIQINETDEHFISVTADYAVRLFRQSAAKEENTMISPLSVMIALAMTANGAEGISLLEMEQLLGGEDISELNAYLAGWLPRLLASECLGIGNSLWVKDQPNVVVQPDFLQTMANYYQAEIFQEPFTEDTVKAVNDWADRNTGGLIKKIIEKLDPNTIMCLINAIVFDAQWAEVYTLEQVAKKEFTNLRNQKETVDFMYGEESFYLQDKQARGFLKPYKGYKFSFGVLLPDEEVAISDYIKQMTGSDFLRILETKQEAIVNTALPKFSYETSLEMTEILKALGMNQAFDENAAEFGKLVDLSRIDNVFVSSVIHKTFIAVDELGTKAGAVTAVIMDTKAAPMEVYSVVLDRPFIYFIIDNASGLPIFIGTVMTVK